MRRWLVPAILFLTATGGPPPAAAADDARVDAFFAACLTGFRDPGARAEAVKAAGFGPVADDVHPRLASIMKLSRREMAEAAKEKFGTALAVYGRGAGSAALYLVTTEVDQPPENTSFRIDLMGCHLYDFAATAPIDSGPLTRRLVQPPAQTAEEPGSFVTSTWASGVREGIWDVTSTFIPEGSPYAAKTGFSGAMLQVTSTKEVTSTKAK